MMGIIPLPFGFSFIEDRQSKGENGKAWERREKEINKECRQTVSYRCSS